MFNCNVNVRTTSIYYTELTMNTHKTYYTCRDRDLRLVLIMLRVFVYWMCSGVDVPLPYVYACVIFQF